MKAFLTFLVFGLLVSCSDPPKAAVPVASIDSHGESMANETAVTCKVFTIPFNIEFPFGYSPADVIQSARRKILIRDPDREVMVREWRKITQENFYKSEGGGGDMRIVFVLEGDTYGFGAVGRGYVNGKPVVYTPAVEAWAQKYLYPLVGNW